MTREEYEYMLRILMPHNPGPGDVKCAIALTELYESSQWQPIETAPGEIEVLVWCDGRKQIMSRHGAKWWDYEACGWEPTYWQPLPEAPKPSEG